MKVTITSSTATQISMQCHFGSAAVRMSSQGHRGSCHLAHKALNVLKWVLQKRVEYAAVLVTQVALLSKDRHHRPRRRRMPGQFQSADLKGDAAARSQLNAQASA